MTHQPFQSWCEACVIGRSRQSPHAKAAPGEQEVKDTERPEPMIQIDYAYGSTKQKHEIQEGEAVAPRSNPGAEPAQENAPDEPNAEAGGIGSDPLEKPVDYRDQFGLSLVASESITCLPILEKGVGSLKWVTEHLVRLSLQVSNPGARGPRAFSETGSQCGAGLPFTPGPGHQHSPYRERVAR